MLKVTLGYGLYEKKVGRKLSFRDNEIEVSFQDIFKAFSFDEVTCQKMKKYLFDEHFEAKKNHNQLLLQFECRMRELDGFIQKAYEDKLKGLFEEESWRVMDAKWKLEQVAIAVETDVVTCTV